MIANCRTYAANDPAGMPGHNLAVIVALMAELLDVKIEEIVNRLLVLAEETIR